MYECTLDQELNTELLAASWRMLQAAGYMCTQQVAALFCMKGGHVHHLESVMSNLKSDFVIRPTCMQA